MPSQPGPRRTLAARGPHVTFRIGKTTRPPPKPSSDPPETTSTTDNTMSDTTTTAGGGASGGGDVTSPTWGGEAMGATSQLGGDLATRPGRPADLTAPPATHRGDVTTPHTALITPRGNPPPTSQRDSLPPRWLVAGAPSRSPPHHASLPHLARGAAGRRGGPRPGSTLPPAPPDQLRLTVGKVADRPRPNPGDAIGTAVSAHREYAMARPTCVLQGTPPCNPL